MPTVSVIIPTWNRAAQLEAAVRSVLAQTHPVHEVLVCDDGSTDDSQQRLAAIGDARVQWLSGPRAGRPAVPRNRGIAAASGEWLAFLDSDDTWLPEKLEQQLNHASTLNARAVSTNAWRVLPEQGRTNPYLQYPNDRIGLTQLIATNFVICSSAMVHRSCVQQAVGFPEAPALRAIEDYAFWLRVATQTDFAYLSAPLVDYTDTPAQSVRADVITLAEQRERVFTDAWNWCKQQPGVSKTANNQLRRACRKALRANGKYWESWRIR